LVTAPAKALTIKKGKMMKGLIKPMHSNSNIPFLLNQQKQKAKKVLTFIT
jgi:hypothetical protein